MNRTVLISLGVALLAVGVVLLIFGLNERDSFGSDVSRFFTGNPTDRSMQLIIGGIGIGVLGVVLSLVSFRKSK